MNYIQSLLLIFLFLPILLKAQIIENGVIHDTLSVTGKPDQLYVLYVPKNYDPSIKWPVVLFFDPSGYPLNPITLYAPLAEELGFILIGTYNSRNGPMEPGYEAFWGLINELNLQYSIDEKSITTSGFSGGSRLSMAIAKESKIVKNVIACGAGQPFINGLHPSKTDNYNYVSLTGNLDFNLLEMIDLHAELEALSINNYRILFEGAHQWPPLQNYREALLWIKLQNAKKENKSMAKKQFSENLLFNISSSIKKNNLVEAQRLYDYLNSYFENTDEIQFITETLQQKTKEIQIQQRSHRRILKLESSYTSDLRKNFLKLDQKLYRSIKPNADSIDLNNWTVHINKFMRLQNSKDSLKSMLGSRMRSFIAAGMAERSFQYSGIENIEVAIKLNKLWVMADDGIRSHWMIARLYTISNDFNQAINHIIFILEHTPTIDLERISSDPILSQLTTKKEFKSQILEKSK